MCTPLPGLRTIQTRSFAVLKTLFDSYKALHPHSDNMPAAEKALVDRFLTKYKDGDLDGMNACLDSTFTFSDPAFPNLDGRFAGCHRILYLTYSLDTHIARHGKGMFAMFIKNRHINKMELTYTPIEGDGPEVVRPSALRSHHCY
jgi:hypothetical protein